MKNEKNQLKIGVVLNYINLILGNLIPIFYTPIMLRLLGQNEYGLYKLSSGITGYLSLITLGMGTAITRYLIKYRVKNDNEGEEKILGLFMIIFQIISILTFLIGILVIINLPLFYGNSLDINQLNTMKLIVFILVLNMSISFMLTPYTSVINAHEKFIFMQSINIISVVILPIANLVVLYFGYKSIGLALVSMSTTIIINICNLVYVKKYLNINAIYKNLPLNLLKEIFCFSFWIFIANVVAQLYSTTDTLMIGTIPKLATSGIAIYNVGMTFVNIVGMLSGGLSGVLAPKTNRLVFEGKNEYEITNFAISIGRIQGYISLLITTGFIVFGKQFIFFYAGPNYINAYWVAICVMLPNFIPTVETVFLNVIIAQNKHKFRSFVYFGIAVINVIGTWLVLDKYGIVGAAFVTGAALFIGSGIVINIYYWKYIKIDIPRFWKNIMPIIIIPLLLCTLGIVIFKYIDIYNPIKLILSIILYTIIYILLNWKLVMNEYEKNLLIKPIRIITRIIKK